MVRLLGRKRFVRTLGAAGIGLGVLASAGGASAATAFEKRDASACHDDADAREFAAAGGRGEHEALRVAAYKEFTRALAAELRIDDPDDVDAAIRAALMAEADANTGLSRSMVARQKALIADAAAPIGPAYRGFGG